MVLGSNISGRQSSAKRIVKTDLVDERLQNDINDVDEVIWPDLYEENDLFETELSESPVFKTTPKTSEDNMVDTRRKSVNPFLNVKNSDVQDYDIIDVHKLIETQGFVFTLETSEVELGASVCWWHRYDTRTYKRTV
jgi:hypothetical protein